MAEGLLLDTHVLIWWFALPERLSPTVWPLAGSPIQPIPVLYWLTDQ